MAREPRQPWDSLPGKIEEAGQWTPNVGLVGRYGVLAKDKIVDFVFLA